MSIRVLIVDPDQSLLDSYHDYLTIHGFEVESASTGSEGLSRLRTWKPDVLVLEPDMPDAWGEKILDQLRQVPGEHCIPVLILTRRDRATLAHPVREYHVKPLSMGELAHSIRSVVKIDSPQHPRPQS